MGSRVSLDLCLSRYSSLHSWVFVEKQERSHMAHIKALEVEAFCVTCPSAEEVTTLLQTLGFELTFHMEIDHPPEYEQVPCLPAQFHFQDTHGNEVIFLAGRDTDLDGVGFPEHASRFWLYPGADR